MNKKVFNYACFYLFLSFSYCEKNEDLEKKLQMVHYDYIEKNYKSMIKSSLSICRQKAKSEFCQNVKSLINNALQKDKKNKVFLEALLEITRNKKIKKKVKLKLKKRKPSKFVLDGPIKKVKLRLTLNLQKITMLECIHIIFKQSNLRYRILDVNKFKEKISLQLIRVPLILILKSMSYRGLTIYYDSINKEYIIGSK
ncbi:MAG: hypothetical protein COB02_02075 [Candidatus Cloacimonadota bacterium]|nr:MAG: hypothetical protein COB02_02075 [Candidatus Cloacimonadota bacterium]